MHGSTKLKSSVFISTKLLVHVKNHKNPTKAVITYFLRIHFNITSPSNPRSKSNTPDIMQEEVSFPPSYSIITEPYPEPGDSILQSHIPFFILFLITLVSMLRVFKLFLLFCFGIKIFYTFPNSSVCTTHILPIRCTIIDLVTGTR